MYIPKELEESVFDPRENSRGCDPDNGSISDNIDPLSGSQPRGFGAVKNRFFKFFRYSYFSFVNKQWSVRSSVVFIIVAFFASLLIMMLLDPDLLFFQRLGFTLVHDSELPREHTFGLISNFYHGGIQLWDPYDQVNYAYSQMSSGVYTISNSLTAILYLIFAPFFDYPGEMQHSFHALVWHGINMLIRTVGGFLLVRRFTDRPWVILISIVYLNSLLTNELYSGLLTNNLYSYLPLLLFFILRFFDEFCLNDFLAIILLGTIIVAGSPLFALGYFYMVVHLFVACCIVYALFFREKTKNRIEGENNKLRTLSKICAVVALCFFIILPNLYWAHSLKNDFFIEESGFGQTEGRLNSFLNPEKYFKMPKSHRTTPNDFLVRSFDFEKNQMSDSWLFVGATTLILSALGMILAKNRRKHIFFWTIALVILTNCPRDVSFPLSIAHWINAYTNPFSFLVRGFQMSALLMPVLFLPLIAMGFESIQDLINDKSEKTYTRRNQFVTIFLIIGACYLAFANFPYFVKSTALFSVLIFLGIFYIIQHRLWKSQALPCYTLLALVMMIDLIGLSIYLKNDTYNRSVIEPKKYSGLGDQNPQILEFQNPQIFPLSNTFRSSKTLVSPPIFSYACNYGSFYHFTPMCRFFDEPNIYAPRLLSYKGIDSDIAVQDHLRKHKNLFEFIPTQNDSAAQERKIIKHTFDLSRAKITAGSYGQEYAFRLPSDFPSYLATTVFTDDRYDWQVSLDGHFLKTAQGKLVEPWTFDVQNVRTDHLTLLLPDDFAKKAAVINLEVKDLEFLTNVWSHQHDALGWMYDAPSDGWYIIHYPYDEKWRLTIDDKPEKIYRTDTYFMGFPLTRGKHKILFEYWPDTYLRFWIILSVIGALVGFALVVGYGINKEQI